MPALDGLRGLALIAVLLFHSRFDWAKGGYLGVTTFFVLSGFLITGLLIRERDATGRIDLKDFWKRRIRRLAPAILVLVALVIAYVALGTGRPPRSTFGDGISVLIWVTNWRFVLTGNSYATLFSEPSPFEHMWSLAVEEQIYLLLPIIAILFLGRQQRVHRGKFAVALIVLIGASTAAAAFLRTPGTAPMHEYYGTDARAAEPLLGALLAIALVGPKGLASFRRWFRAGSDVLAAGGLLVLAYLMSNVPLTSETPYRGGFLLAALASAAVVAAASQQKSLFGRALSIAPLAALGRISYGAYLFHWPIFLWLTPGRTGLSEIPLLGLRCVLTLTLAAVSHQMLEVPIRSGHVSMRRGVPAWAGAALGLLAGLALVTTSTAAKPSRFETENALKPPPVAVAPVTPAGGGQAKQAPARQKTPGDGGTAGAPANKRNADAGAALMQGPSAEVAPPPAVAPGVLRVAITGDSLAWDIAQGLSGWASARSDVVAYDLTTPGCPISRGGTRRMPDYFPWAVDEKCSWWSTPQNDRFEYLVTFKPDIVVFQDGANEMPDRKLEAWPTYRHTGEPLFDQWLLSEYSDFFRTISAQGGRALALNAVCGDWERLGHWEGFARNGEGSKRITTLNATIQGSTASGANVADFHSRLCPGGRFTGTVEGVADGRPDGYHLSEEAALAVASKWLGPLILDMR